MLFIPVCLGRSALMRLVCVCLCVFSGSLRISCSQARQESSGEWCELEASPWASVSPSLSVKHKQCQHSKTPVSASLPT